MRELPVFGGSVALVDVDAPPWVFRAALAAGRGQNQEESR